MLIVTTDNVPGKEILDLYGLVKGSTIQSKHLGKDIGASFKGLIGGELKGYNEMLNEARKIAIDRMIEDAKQKGANAIIGFRLQSVGVMQGAAEILAYGTAVRV